VVYKSPVELRVALGGLEVSGKGPKSPVESCEWPMEVCDWRVEVCEWPVESWESPVEGFE